MKNFKCRLGVHNWIYLIKTRVCLICGRTDEIDKEGCVKTVTQPVFKLRNPLEIKETQIISENLNKTDKRRSKK